MSRMTKIYVAIMAVIIGVVVWAIVHIATGGGVDGAQALSDGQSVTAAQTVNPTPVAQPSTAAQIAKSLNCGKFQESTPANKGLFVVDGGKCWIDGVKYFVNVYGSTAVRDNMIKAMADLGVVPKWETSTAVIGVAS